jgi:hypothetical protein
MADSFRDLVEKLSSLSEKHEKHDDYTCPLCDENPCECDLDNMPKKEEPIKEDKEGELKETVTAQRLAKEFADTDELPYALRVFLKLKSGDAEQLNNNDRLEAAKILKMLIPTISEDDLFSRISNDLAARSKAANAAQTAPAPGAVPTQVVPGATAAAHSQETAND